MPKLRLARPSIATLRNRVPRIIRRLIWCVYGWHGNYPTWAAACKASGGYDSEKILKKVCASTEAVLQGRAVAERDGMLLDETPYSWPVVSALLWAASQNENRLSVLDFGGSLGCSFHHAKSFLSHIENLQWCVVEQPHYVACGRELGVGPRLQFFDSIDACNALHHPHVLLLSSVLQYLEDPYVELEKFLQLEIPVVVVDLTPVFNRHGKERITVQRVPPFIYKASYPSWILDRSKITKKMQDCGYEQVAGFDCDEDMHRQDASYWGAIFRLIKSASALHVEPTDNI